MKFFVTLFLFGVSVQTYSSECYEKRIYSTPQMMKVTCSENFEGSTSNNFLMWESSQFLTVDYIVCPNRDYYVATVSHMPTNMIQTFKCNGEIKITRD